MAAACSGSGLVPCPDPAGRGDPLGLLQDGSEELRNKLVNDRGVSAPSHRTSVGQGHPQHGYGHLAPTGASSLDW